MIALRSLVLVIAAMAASAAGAACHGGAGAASPQPLAGPTCGQVADTVMSTMPQGAGELAGKLHDVIVRRCDQDQWTADARQCVIDAKTHDAAAACEAKLTDAQKQALDHDGDAVIDDFRKHDNNATGGAAPQEDTESDGAGAPAQPSVGAPPPASAPRRSTPKKPDSDPCAGGQ